MQSGMAITLIGLDVTMRTLLHQSDLDRLQQTCKPENRAVADFINRSMQYHLQVLPPVQRLRGLRAAA